jgi:hypothetical protein
MRAYYPVFGLFSIPVLIVIIHLLSGCDFIDGIIREGNSVKHATPTPHETPR